MGSYVQHVDGGVYGLCETAGHARGLEKGPRQEEQRLYLGWQMGPRVAGLSSGESKNSDFDANNGKL